MNILNKNKKLYKLLFLLKNTHPNTYEHSIRVAKYSKFLGTKLCLDDEDMDYLVTAALLHDTGKMLIPSQILHKKGKLTDEEFKIMKLHSSYSADLVKDAGGDFKLIKIIKAHHERFDGKGYPDGLKDNEIPFLTKIITLSDTFDAMTSKRCYKESMSLNEVINEIIRCSGTQFDPDLAKVFLKYLKIELENQKNNKENVLDNLFEREE